MASPDPISRRRFLRRTVRAPRVVELSCERLYIRYMDAVGAGRLSQFSCALDGELSGADIVKLTDREWLARDDFRAAVERSLDGCRARRVR
jgi:hypothetical protein